MTRSTRERRPPWPSQIITPILPNVNMLSHHDLAVLLLLWYFFAQLLLLEYQTVITSSLYYPKPLHKISSQSVYNFLSNVVHKQTNRQTGRQTNATKCKNITSFVKKVKCNNCATNIIDIMSNFVIIYEESSVNKYLGYFNIFWHPKTDLLLAILKLLC